MRRDFTYVEDIVYGILGAVVLNKKFKHRIYNLGNNRPEVLIDFVKLIEKDTWYCSKKNFYQYNQVMLKRLLPI